MNALGGGSGDVDRARAVASPVHVVVSDGDQVAGLELGRVADGGIYVDLGPGDE
jgi:hypothetical protein